MNYYAIVDQNKKIIQLFGWGDNRLLPAGYPHSEGTNIVEIPEKFAKEMQEKWQDSAPYIKDISAAMDSSKGYSEYFSDMPREKTEASPKFTVEDLQKQIADLQTQIKEMKANG